MCRQTLRSGKGWETRAHPRWHACLRNDTGADGEVKGQGCSALQIWTLSSIAQALAAIAKWILPWQRASPGAGGSVGVLCWGQAGGEAEMEGERDAQHRRQRREGGQAPELSPCQKQ